MTGSLCSATTATGWQGRHVAFKQCLRAFKGWSQVHFSGSSMMNLSTHSLRGNTRLPLVECPDYKKAALLELTCRKGANAGKLFYKCPMNQQNDRKTCSFFMWTEEYVEFLTEKGVIQEDTSSPEDVIPYLVEATSTPNTDFEAMKAELAELKACNGNTDATMCKVLKQGRVSITIGALNLLVVALVLMAVIVVLGK